MKVLVLGGGGFIGSHVVDALLTAGHIVRVYDRSVDKYRGNLNNVDYVLGDFSNDLLLSEALLDIDVVFHGVSTTIPSTSNIDPIKDAQTNLLPTLNLLECMLKKNVRRIVYLSSGGTVYGRTTVTAIHETHSLHPVCSYGVVKVAIENYLFMFQELYGLQPLVIRPSNPYGERQGNTGVQGVIGTFLSKIKKGEQIEIWGDGEVVRDFIYVKDLAKACLQSIESEVTGVFNVGGGCGYSINEVVEIVKDVTGITFHPLYSASRGFDVPRVVLDIFQAKDKLDWQPRTSLYDGVLKTWSRLTA